MNSLTDRLKHWWQNSDRGQKLITLGGVGVLCALVATVFMFATRPRYETLFANLTEQEQSAVVTDLQGMGFDVKFDRAGVVEVAASEKATARVKLAAANKLPKAQGQWGLGELNTMPFGVTPSVEQVRLRAIAEGEISKSIEAMDGIENARVHLTLPERTAFVEDKSPVTASISLTTAADSNLNAAQGRAIALLVKNAVDGLDLKNVVVVDQHLRTIWNGEDEKSDGVSGAAKKTDLDDEVSRKRQRELQTILDSAFGPGAAIVTVHADVDMDSSRVVMDQKTPSTKPLTVESQNESVNGSSPVNGGVGGVKGQTPIIPNLATDSKGNYSGKTETTQYLENDRQEETSKATGSVRGMAINVVVDSTRITDTSKVQRLLAGDLADKAKIDPKTFEVLPNQPYSVTVTAVEFDKTASKEAAKEAAAAASQQRIQQMLSILPIAALLIVAALVVKQVAKFAKSHAFAPMALTTEGIHLPAPSQTALPVADASSAELSSLLAELDGSSMTRRPQLELQHVEVEDIKNRVHMPLEQLKKMAAERPALVAQLIKSMLLEERK